MKLQWSLLMSYGKRCTRQCEVLIYRDFVFEQWPQLANVQHRRNCGFISLEGTSCEVISESFISKTFIVAVETYAGT